MEEPMPSRRHLVQRVSAGDFSGMMAELEALRHRYSQEAVAATIVSCEEGEDRNPKSCLHLSALRGRASMLRVLLESNGNPNSKDDAGNTALHFACDRGHARAVHVLLTGGAASSSMNNFGRAPAKCAEEQSWDPPEVKAGKALVRRMLEGDVGDYESLPPEPPVPKPQAPSQNEATRAQGALQGVERYAALVGSKGAEEVRSEVARRESHYAPSEASTAALVGDLDQETGRHLTFTDIVRRGDLVAVEYHLGQILARDGQKGLIAAVTNTEEDPREDTRVVASPLHIAARYGHAKVLSVLLGTRADPNLMNDSGDTLLHAAAGAGRFDAVQALIAAGADPGRKNNFGRSPEELLKPEAWESDEVRGNKQRLSGVWARTKSRQDLPHQMITSCSI